MLDYCGRWAGPFLVAVALVACGTPGGNRGRPGITATVLPDAKPEAKNFFEEGLRLFHEGPQSHEEARAEFKRAVEADASLFEAWHDLGLCEAKLGRWEEARKALARALKLQPASRPTVIALGEALVRLARWEEARAVYGKWIAASPDDAEIRLHYTAALREGGEGGDALEEVKKLLQANSKNADAFNALGLIYYRIEKYGLAESALSRAAELDPKAAPVWNNLGLVALARGRDADAFALFEKASNLDSRYAGAHVNKAIVYMDCGDYARAMQEIDKAIEIDPADPDIQVTRGVAARGLRKFDEARAAYERALALAPRYPAALYNLGILYMDFQPDKAKSRENFLLFKKVVSSEDPKHADVVARLEELK